MPHNNVDGDLGIVRKMMFNVIENVAVANILTQLENKFNSELPI